MELKANILEIAQKLRAQVAQRKALAILLSILVLLLSSGIIFIALRGAARTPSAPDPIPVQTIDINGKLDEADSQVEVLPQTERLEREGTLQPLDPFASPPMLVGVLLGGGGEDMAIIEAGGNTYITRVGDVVAGLWQVSEIHRDKTIIYMGENKTVLYLGR